MTLPTFAAERRRLLHGAPAAGMRPASEAIDRLFAERSTANPPRAAAAAVDGRDKQTDGQTDGCSTILQTLLRILWYSVDK